MSIIIFTPITIKPTGGTSSFARKFQQQAANQSHQVIFSYQKNYDVLLVITSCPARYILDAILRNKPIIHRLDGVYYPNTVAGNLAPLYNLKPKIIHKFLATKTIYQSKYSRHCTEKFFGRPHSQIQATIYNGVDTNHFTPDGPNQTLRDNPNQHLFITWSRFRRPDQIEPLILAIEKYRHSYQKNSKLVILGKASRVASRPCFSQNTSTLALICALGVIIYFHFSASLYTVKKPLMLVYLQCK